MHILLYTNMLVCHFNWSELIWYDVIWRDEIYACVHIYIYIYKYIHTCIYIYICAYMYICTCQRYTIQTLENLPDKGVNDDWSPASGCNNRSWQASTCGRNCAGRNRAADEQTTKLIAFDFLWRRHHTKDEWNGFLSTPPHNHWGLPLPQSSIDGRNNEKRWLLG